MHFRLYKEGQGIWARGSLAFVIGATGLTASISTYNFFEEQGLLSNALDIGIWALDLKSIVAIAILLPMLWLGYRLYNHERLADFLIDTESELKNKVTWPSMKVAMNNSYVVVVTCVVLAVWILVADGVFDTLKRFVYP